MQSDRQKRDVSRLKAIQKRGERLLFAIFLVAAVLAMPVHRGAGASSLDEITTPGGIRAWLVRESSIPLVSMRFAFAGGAVDDPIGQEGAVSLMTSLLTEGAGVLDAAAFAREMAGQGARISFSTGRDQVFGSFDALSARLEPSAELLRLALQVPRFDDEAFLRAKQQRIADIEQSAADGRRIAIERWYAEAFPEQRYGRPVDGTLASVNALTAGDVRQLHKALTKRTLKIVVVGDITRDQASSVLDRVFADLPTGVASAKHASTMLDARVQTPIQIEKDLPVATAAFGLVTMKSSHPDFTALRILNQIIGSGDFDATLMEEIRVKRGLAYAVSTALVNDTSAALMLGGMSTKPENMPAALSTLRDVVGTIGHNGPEPAKFEAAKSYLIGTRALDFDGTTRRASTLLKAWIDGRQPADIEAEASEIERMTLADVTRVARQILSWDRLRIVTVAGRSGVTARHLVPAE